MKRIFNSDEMTLVGHFEEADRDKVIKKYEELGYEVSTDHDDELVICQPE